MRDYKLASQQHDACLDGDSMEKSDTAPTTKEKPVMSVSQKDLGTVDRQTQNVLFILHVYYLWFCPFDPP
jgi:hypothetical protein